jgi:DNA invertase Pin-like site-specific DNA recombinase
VSLVGYARVSTKSQDPGLQLSALQGFGCERVFFEQTSGAAAARPVLDEALRYVRPGDTLCVWRLDRLGRRTAALVTLLDELHGRGIEFASITEGMDTRTQAGKLLYMVAAWFAENEREVLRDRTRAGLEAARERGIRGGRPPTMGPAKVTRARELLALPGATVAGVARTLGVSRPVLYRALPDEIRALSGR